MEIGEARSIYMKGVQAMGENNLTTALSNFIQISQLKDDGKPAFDKLKARAFYFLGDVYFVMESFEQAIANYQKVVQKYYQHDIYTKALYKLGRTLILTGRLDEGIGVLSDYSAKYENADGLADKALYWTGRGYAAKGSYQQAYNTFQLIMNRYPATSLSYEIQSSMEILSKWLDNKKSEKQLAVAAQSTNDTDAQKKKGITLAEEKALLIKMSKLLEIKQKLLEIKAEKVEMLTRLKELREN